MDTSIEQLRHAAGGAFTARGLNRRFSGALPGADAPELAVGDGAQGFRKAMNGIFPGTRHQRCWFHKHVATRAEARAALETFKEKYSVKFAKGVACLARDAEALLAFHDVQAEHRDHMWTPKLTDGQWIETVFATVRHRTIRTMAAHSQKTAKFMVFTLGRAASRKWRKLNARNQLPQVIEGVRFIHGVARLDADQAQAA